MERKSGPSSSHRAAPSREWVGGAPAPGGRSALVLRLNAARLRADGLALDEATRLLPSLCFDATVEVREATSTGELLRVFAELVERRRSFDVVAVIGHSHADGIRVSDDKVANWEEFAAWLAPLAPRCLVLVACQAGRWSAARALFQRLPQLQRLFAAPVNACLDQGRLMVTLIPCLLLDGPPPELGVRAVQGVLALSLGAQLRAWARGDMDEPDGHLLDFVADVLQPWLRGT